MYNHHHMCQFGVFSVLSHNKLSNLPDFTKQIHQFQLELPKFKVPVERKEKVKTSKFDFFCS